MSTFKNISPGVLYLQGYLRQANGVLGSGAVSYIAIGETFTGSNYYKRFTYDGLIAAGYTSAVAAEEAILEVVTDDGSVFSDSAATATVPYVYHESLTAGSSAVLNFATDLGGPAYFMTLESDQDIYCYLNGSATARINVEGGSQVSFSNGELLLNSITIANTISGASTATVQVIVGGLV